MTVASTSAESETATHPETSGWQRRHVAIITGVAVLEAITRTQVPQAQDIYWEARSGLETVRTGAVPRSDTYSWSAHGASWIPNSWGWNVVLGEFYNAFSVVGLWLLGVIGTVALGLAVAVAARRVGAPPVPTIAAFAPLAFLGELAMPRAQMVSNVAIVLLPILIRPLMYATGRRAVRAFVALVVLQTVWVNLHSMALIGPPVLGAGCGALVIRNFRTRRWSGAYRGGIAALVAAACCAVTPYSVSLISHAGDVRSASVGLITEWDSVGVRTAPQIIGLAAVLGLITLAARAWTQGRAEIAGPLLLLAVLGASAIRFIPMAALVAIPEVGLLLARLNVRKRIFDLLVGLGCFGLFVLAVTNWRDPRQLEPVVSPRLVAMVPAGCRVLNDDLVGDALILERPDVLVSLDGRNDMYGRSGVLRVVRLLADHPGTDQELAANGVDCILAPTDQRLIQRLRHDSGWVVTAQDAFRTLLVRHA